MAIKVYVDNREVCIFNVLKNIFDYEVVTLPVGDILVTTDSNALIVERKTCRDFINSIKTNRLWDQLLRLMKTEKILGYEVQRRLLVIQGGFWEYTNVSNINTEHFWKTISGSLLSIQFVYDTPCIVCENNYAFESFLQTLIKREESGKNDAAPKPRWYRIPKEKLPEKNSKQYVLDAIPMIGNLQAEKLLDHFGSISNIARSTIDELAEAPGIGKKRAEMIYQTFH